MDLQPPRAPQKHYEISLHGDTRHDPWFWLRDREDPDTLEYLKAENDFTNAVMKPTEGLQEALYAEMRGRIKEDDADVPEKDGDYYYYTRFEEGGQYPLYCRKYRSLDGDEELLLDVNQLAKGHSYFRVGVFKNSPDHQWLAYSVNIDGSEEYTIHIINLQTGETLSEAIPNTYYSLEWSNDSSTFFYVTLDGNHRPTRIFRHRRGDEPATDRLVFQEDDPGFFLRLTKSASSRFIYVVVYGNNTTEWHFLNADHPEGQLTRMEARQEGFDYEVADHGDHFLVLHNGDGAKDFKISVTPISSPARENWQDFLSHRPGQPIRGVLAFQEHLAVSYREGGLPQVQILGLTGGQGHTIGFEEEVYSVRVQRGREWDTATLRFTYSSMTTPAAVYDYDMNTRERKLLKQTEVLGGFNAENYLTKRLLAPAQDGSQIPISIVYRKRSYLDGPAPVHLTGYGAYGGTVEANFSSAQLSLLDRGFIIAYAHLRGGMELGWDWYENGKLLRKKNTFTDFIDCAQHLVNKGYTSAGDIVADGGSAGGLVMAVAANWRPDLFKAVVARVPFVDVLNTMLDATQPLITKEYSEWGNPNQPDHYEYIKSYSPYDNVKAQDYPHMLMTTGLNDARSAYWEPAKWTARLRSLKTDDNLLLLKVNFGSGHSGASGRFERLKEVALEYAFILKAFGLDGEPGPIEGMTPASIIWPGETQQRL